MHETMLARLTEHITVDGKEALKAFRAAAEKKANCDLICMNIVMPEMDGHAAVMEIRRIETGCRSAIDQRGKDRYD